MGIGDSLQSVASKKHMTNSKSIGAKDFIILCPVVAENSGVIETLYALYYLPPNFNLLMTKAGVKSKALFARIREIMSTETIKDRIVVQDETRMPGMASSFLTADVVVYGSSDPVYTKDAPQAIIVFDIASKLMSINGEHNFAVASSDPESVASAILQVARNQQSLCSSAYA